MAFSTLMWQRGSLTYDFSIFNQGRWLLAHGDLNPFITVNGIPYWQNHGEALMWPLAQLTRLPPHGLWLLYLEDIAVVGAGWVVVSWAHSMLHRQKGISPAAAAAAMSLICITLLLNPWTYYTVAWDFHFEPISALFAILLAYRLHSGRGNRRSCIYALLTMATGDVGCLFVVGASLGAVLAGKHRKWAMAIGACALGWTITLTLLHANKGSLLQGGYGYLAGPISVSHTASLEQIVTGALTHPGRALSGFWANRVDLWANIAPSGVLGVASPWGLAMVTLDLLPTLIHSGHLFAAPGFQNVATYFFVALGTIWVLVRFARRPRVILTMTGVLGCMSLGWAFVWLPRYPATWLHVTPDGGDAISSILRSVPSNAEVVASNGIVGRFSGRKLVYALLGMPDRVPLRGRPVYFVLSPRQGIEMPVQETDAVLKQVVSSLRARLVYYAAGIWEFRWQPPRGQNSVVLQARGGSVPAWALAGPSGVSIAVGPARTWRTASDGQTGYVVDHDYWYLAKGDYEANVEISCNGGGDVEVWNAYHNTLLARREINPTDGPSVVHIPFVQPLAGSDMPFGGVGPFSIAPVAPPLGQQIEVRVYAPGTTDLSVYTISIVHAK